MGWGWSQQKVAARPFYWISWLLSTALGMGTVVRSFNFANQLIHRDSADFNSFFFLLHLQCTLLLFAARQNKRIFQLLLLSLSHAYEYKVEKQTQITARARTVVIKLLTWKLLIRKNVWMELRWWCKCGRTWNCSRLNAQWGVGRWWWRSRDDDERVRCCCDDKLSKRNNSECQMLTELIYILKGCLIVAMRCSFYFVCANKIFSLDFQMVGTK